MANQKTNREGLTVGQLAVFLEDNFAPDQRLDIALGVESLRPEVVGGFTDRGNFARVSFGLAGAETEGAHNRLR